MFAWPFVSRSRFERVCDDLRYVEGRLAASRQRADKFGAALSEIEKQNFELRKERDALKLEVQPRDKRTGRMLPKEGEARG